MSGPPELTDAIDLDVQEVLLAATNHDISALRTLIRKDEQLVNAQDAETGFTPLHAAIAACEADEQPVNGHANGDHGIASGPETATLVDKAKATIQWLLQQGAVWNQLDANGETPGCVAYRLGLKDLYEVMVDAGTRAEMLLSRLEEYAQLADEDEDEGEEDETEEEAQVESSLAELSVAEPAQEVAEDNQTFLKSELTFQPEALMDRDANGVMMSWETEIMEKTVELLVPSDGLRILNIGHGMGIVDTQFQAKKPSSHHIIEAHPDVLEQMRKDGWHEKPGVVVHEGRWQDVVPELIDAGEQFDAIFYDTFAEDYKAFKTLFDEHMIGLLEDSGKWSFFNGLGADRQISYDVYKNILSMDLQECGYEIAWTEIDVPDLAGQGTWEATKRPYWTLKKYQLPICSFFS